MAVFGHLIDFNEILFVIAVSLFNIAGEEVDTNLYFLDTTTPRDCPSNVACFFPEDKSIWVRVDKLDRTDKCGRSVILHELMHVKYDVYPEIDAHDCNLSTSMFITKVKTVDIWSTTT